MGLHDLTGQRFGKLVVLERIPTVKRTKWKCLCDCGSFASVYAFNLVTGNTTTCGCSGRGRLSKIDITGQRFGKLVALYQVGNGSGGTEWMCQCDCGGTAVKRSDALRNGDVKTCGCGSHPMKHTDPTTTSFNDLLRQYRRNAEKTGRSFDLTAEQFRQLTSQCCRYCGKEPSQVGFFRQVLRKTEGTQRKPYVFNGIDRVNNDIGYTVENTVPCCKVCNWMKSKLSEADFLAHVRQIVAWSASQPPKPQSGGVVSKK